MRSSIDFSIVACFVIGRDKSSDLRISELGMSDTARPQEQPLVTPVTTTGCDASAYTISFPVDAVGSLASTDEGNVQTARSAPHLTSTSTQLFQSAAAGHRGHAELPQFLLDGGPISAMTSDMPLHSPKGVGSPGRSSTLRAAHFSSSTGLGFSIQSDGYVCEELARELAPLGTPGIEPPPPSQFMTLVEGDGPTSREMWARLGADVMMQYLAGIAPDPGEDI